MKYLLVVILSVMLITVALAQVDTSWTRRWTSAGANGDYVYGLAVDGSGNVYVTGGSNYLGTTPELLTIKYNASGDTVWTRVPVRTGSQMARAVAVGSSGNVYITGYTMETGNGDFITIKYRADGSEAWTRLYNGPYTGYDFARKLVLDNNENVYVSGYSQEIGGRNTHATVKYDSSGNLLWAKRDSFGGAGSLSYPADLGIDYAGNPYIVSKTATASQGTDYVVAKYNASNGETLWVRTYNGPANGADDARAIAFDNTNNVYVTGMIAGSGSGNDIATIKYNSSGVQQWVSTYTNPDTTATDAGYWIAVDGLGNVYVCGSTYSIGGANQDIGLIKYNSSGTELWKIKYNGPGGYDAPIDKDGQKGMVLDPSGNIYVSGTSRQSASTNENDFVTTKCNSSGVAQWVARYNYADSFETAYAIDVDNQGNVLVTGRSCAPNSYYDCATIKYQQVQGIEQNITNDQFKIANFSIYPSPFKNFTTIRYSLLKPSSVSLSIYDVSGKLVRTLLNESKPTGHFDMVWDGLSDRNERANPGIYFFVLKVNSDTQQKKALLFD
jgi:uncharacterized delta-60 repeat protein